MAQTALRSWTIDEFFTWQERQEERYELVGGLPVRMMVGASNRHDRVVLNLLVQLGTRLRGSDCVPFTGDSGLETYPGQIRRPDAGVDCGPRDQSAFKAAAPRLVAEVLLSPSTRDFDTIGKLAEYKGVESLEHILYVEPNHAKVMAWSRGPDRAWIRVRVEEIALSVELPALGIALPLADIYEGVEFPAVPPRLAGP